MEALVYTFLLIGTLVSCLNLMNFEVFFQLAAVLSILAAGSLVVVLVASRIQLYYRGTRMSKRTTKAQMAKIESSFKVIRELRGSSYKWGPERSSEQPLVCQQVETPPLPPPHPEPQAGTGLALAVLSIIVKIFTKR